jgi:hypothetical protein
VLLRGFLLGKVSTVACTNYCALLTQRENAILVDALRKTGHGHPRTLLNYYFAIGDLLMSVFATASLKNHTTVRSLTALNTATTAAAFRKAYARARHGDATLDEWAWLSRHFASKCVHLPHFFDQEVAASLELPKRNLVTRARPAPDDAKSLISSVQYLAVRMVGMSSQAASVRLNLSGDAIRSLEASLGTNDFSHLRNKHQLSADMSLDAGARSEIRYLLSEEGRHFALKLMGSDPKVLEAFSEALGMRRTRKADAVDVLFLSTTFKLYAHCLPESLGLLVQFGKGRISTRDALRLSSPRDRVYIDKLEADLGNRPRVSVITKDKPKQYAARARRTANTRCLIQAARLLNFSEYE